MSFSAMPGAPRLYSDLASWWPLMSPPSHYIEEAAYLVRLLHEGPDAEPARTLLELGCGGGSLAYNLKRHFTLTLTDSSPAMLAVSREINPECEHLCADMTSLDLGREFDRVLVHDAIMYATDPEAVRATLRSAARHCRPGGRLIVLPDCVRETFAPATETGGEDAADGRALRFLQWRWDPDAGDNTYEVELVLMLREPHGDVRVEQERHRFGCFSRADWLRWFGEAGFRTRRETDRWKRDVFIGVKSGPAR